jgi:hypothetical protein
MAVNSRSSSFNESTTWKVWLGLVVITPSPSPIMMTLPETVKETNDLTKFAGERTGFFCTDFFLTRQGFK